MSHEQILGTEAILEGKTRQTGKQQHTGGPVQKTTGARLIKPSSTLCFQHSSGRLEHPCRSLSRSMLLNWSRSRMSRRTRSSWERLSNTVTSSRYVVSQRPVYRPVFLFTEALHLSSHTVWAKPVLGLFASLNFWPEEVLSCCASNK